MAVENRKILLKNDCLDYFINTRPRLLWAVGATAIRSDGSKAWRHSDWRLLQTLSAYTHTHLFQQPGYTWGSLTLPGTFQEPSSYIFFNELKSESIILNHLHAIEHVGFYGVSYLLTSSSNLYFSASLTLWSISSLLKVFIVSNVDFVLPAGTSVCSTYIDNDTGVYVKGHVDFRIATLVSKRIPAVWTCQAVFLFF